MPTVPRCLAWNGNVDDESIPDYVEPPHVDTDNDFDNELIGVVPVVQRGDIRSKFVDEQVFRGAS